MFRLKATRSSFPPIRRSIISKEAFLAVAVTVFRSSWPTSPLKSDHAIPKTPLFHLSSSHCRGLDGVLSSPLPRGGFVSGAIGLVDVGDLRHQRVVWVRVCEHGADGEEDCSFTVSACISMSIKVPSLSFLLSADIDLPFEIVRAGLHWSLRMSKQMLPLLLMFGW